MVNVFQYDQSFEGLLTCIFEAYDRKCFPERLMGEEAVLPLFCEDVYRVQTDTARAERVWKALEKKLSEQALRALSYSWLADDCSGRDELMFRYIRKVIDAPLSVEMNFGDTDVLALMRLAKNVSYERMRLIQFVRFQKASDGTYFAPFEPQSNVLPLAVEHFKDRFADQKWLVYDTKRQYGFYYDLQSLEEVTFPDLENRILCGLLKEEDQAADEKLFQDLWKTYFHSICIRERLNPRKHKQDMPVRYWKYLTEKQF